MTAAVTAGAVTAGPGLHGRTKITSRAVRRVVSAVTAEALSVDASDVSVELVDDRGSLTVIAKSPIHVRPLGDVGRRSSGTLLERLGAAQTTIRDRCLQLTGSTIGRVDLRITGVDLRERKRVS
ncbi:hypothetical protein AS850_14855 [Frondihabitans sp. 762G35]|uniref:hypothetical protein n=1 Tax=Frondihabitans sp. 762G35 TaxID=1446794 RepID=UPI000D21F7A5|nr:hypothetical protein [Frondihabitans sp. 762G35]ARC58363.1 hypothetical protein AS850_14855 [Frondihabitans sp. 762G35]